MSSRAWDVYGYEYNEWYKKSTRVYLTTVFYDKDCDEAWVLDGLINHDGYPSNIEIETEDLKECPCCLMYSFVDTWEYDDEHEISCCPDCQQIPA
jgi:hypothetical protein